MNKHETLLWKIDTALIFVDLKVGLLVWILIDLYRNTALAGALSGIDRIKASAALPYVWQTCGSPYLIWIPLVALADILVKRVIRAMVEE